MLENAEGTIKNGHSRETGKSDWFVDNAFIAINKTIDHYAICSQNQPPREWFVKQKSQNLPPVNLITCTYPSVTLKLKYTLYIVPLKTSEYV